MDVRVVPDIYIETQFCILTTVQLNYILNGNRFASEYCHKKSCLISSKAFRAFYDGGHYSLRGDIISGSVRAGRDGGVGRAFALPLLVLHTGNNACYDFYPR